MKAESQQEEVLITPKSILRQQMNFRQGTLRISSSCLLLHHQQQDRQEEEMIPRLSLSSSSSCCSSSSHDPPCSCCYASEASAAAAAAAGDETLLHTTNTDTFSGGSFSPATNTTTTSTTADCDPRNNSTSDDDDASSSATSTARSQTNSCSVQSAVLTRSDHQHTTTATAAKKNNSSRINSSSVKFQSIEIRSYNITLGDNPSCSYGPPITLDWKYGASVEMSINEYEKSRGNRRKSYQMLMNSQYRTKLLREWNITEDEIGYGAKELKTIKKGRERTKMMLPFWKIEDAAESMKRKYKRAVA